MKTVMVGFDRSDQARDALKLGTIFADAFGAKLALEHPVRGYEPSEVARVIDYGGAAFAAMDHAPRDHLLIGSMGNDRRTGVHDIAQARVVGRRQQLFDRDQSDELAPVEHRDVGGRLKGSSDQGLAHAFGGLVRRCDRDALCRVSERDLQPRSRWTLAVKGERCVGSRCAFVVTQTRAPPQCRSQSEAGRGGRLTRS